jgi:hypothetical protein
MGGFHFPWMRDDRAVFGKLATAGDRLKRSRTPRGARCSNASRGKGRSPGQRFTFRTTPMGDWDGVAHCEVLDCEPPRLLRYS